MTSEVYIRKIARRILFENSLSPTLEPLKKTDIDAVMQVCDKAFSEFRVIGLETKCSTGQMHGKFHSLANWDKSAKLVLNGEIIGFVIVSDKETIDNFLEAAKRYGYNIKIDADKLKAIAGKKGIEIMSIGVLPEYRGAGYGKMLFDFPKSLGADYIWSIQMNGVSNMAKWASKGPVVVSGKAMGQEFYVTIQAS